MTEEAPAHRTKCYGMCDMETPFLPDRENCKTAKMKPECDRCGCTQKGEESHMFGTGKGVVWNAKQQCCCCSMILFFVYFVVFGIIQWVCFHWATYNCGSLPANYNFPGGGHGDGTTPGDNLLPRNALIVAREASVYGDAFDVFNSTEEGQMVSAPVGTWFRTWGPWFYTYTYQDTLNSKETVYMRATLAGMSGLLTELKVMRCDGKGEVMKYSEGTAVLGNAFRAFLQTNTGSVYKILIGGELQAVVEETYHGAKSATFRTEGKGGKDVIASFILQGANNDGYNQWFMKNDADSPLKFYMTDAVAVDYAFKIHNEKKKKQSQQYMLLAEQVKTAVSDLVRGHKSIPPGRERKVEVEEQRV